MNNYFDNLDLDKFDGNLLENILKELPSNIFLKDRECRYIFATHYWRHLKIDKDVNNWNIKGKTDLEIRKDAENAKKAYEIDKQIIETGMGVTYTIKIEQDNITEYLEVIKKPVFDSNSNVIGIVGLINDVTQKVIQENQLQTLANIDHLTGLFNRCYLDSWLKNLKDESLYPITLIMADCNNLKKINDENGHLFGDEYIKKSASIMKAVLPEKSLIFRMGGDEFLCILPNCNNKMVKSYIKQMDNFASSIIIGGKKISISFGSSTMENNTFDFTSSLEKADNEMYKEKKIKHKSK